MIETHSTEFDNLLAGHIQPAVTDKVTLKAGKSYKKGTVVAIIDATGAGVEVDSTKKDGSQNPYGILTDDIDATKEDKQATVYLTGQFNASKLKFGGTDTVDAHKRALRNIGIFIVNTQK